MSGPPIGGPPLVDDAPSPYVGPVVGRADASTLADGQLVGFRSAVSGGIMVGESVGIGDFDGNGRRDLAVGASSYDDLTASDIGRAWVVAASSEACTADPETGAWRCDLAKGGYDAQLEGPKREASFGGVMTSGDLDRDGTEDLVIGSPGASRADVWYGRPDLGLLGGEPDASFVGAEGLGFSLAVTADVDGDGCPELALGAHQAAEGRGEVYLLRAEPEAGGKCRRFGQTDVTQGFAYRIAGIARGDHAGYAVADAGDFDGDGDDDLLVGVTTAEKGFESPEPGEVILVYGGADPRELGSCPRPCDVTLARFGPAGAVDAVRYTLPERFDNAWLGNRVEGIGDFDADGCPDVALAAMKYDHQDVRSTGAVFVVGGAGACNGRTRVVADEVVLDGSGDDYLAAFVGEGLDRKLGEAVARGGDFDGDGVVDLLLGEYRDDQHGDTADTNSGSAFLVYGGWSGFDGAAPPVVVLGSHRCDGGGGWPADAPPYLMVYGSDVRQAFGKHVAGGGDVNGDGRDDLWIGVPRYGSSDPSCGEPLCDVGQAVLFHGEATGQCLDQ